MDAVISFAGKIAEPVVVPIRRHSGYIVYYKDNLKKMKTDVQNLEGKKHIVQHKVEEAIRNGEEIEIIVQNWLNTVDNTVAEANQLIDSEGHAKAQCSMGHFPNLCTRYQLGSKIKKMILGISKLEERNFDQVSHRAASQVTVTPFGRGYEALDSRTCMLNEIMMELNNPNIFIIGVYGMGGVGKTTLVKQLAWQARNDGLFDTVVMATISGSPNLEKIHEQIADDLDLKFNKTVKEGRARELRGRIGKEKSILVILDDIWGKLDLEELGIPFGDDHKGCKLVVTSRDLHVLTCEVGTQKEFRLDVLLEEDSWKLFEKMAGDVVVQEFNIKPIAVKVAKCCAGLPLLIVTVAKALRKKDAFAWKDALNQLERFDQGGLLDKVYSTLELSYNCLESEELKLLFSFIGSFGLDDIHNGQLIIFYWGLGLFRNCHTLRDARTRYHKLVNDLKASSLLLESRAEVIRIHDHVRHVAKSIASRTRPTYGIQRCSKVEEWPEMDQLRKYHQIILPWSYIYKLPEKLECPELKLLLLENIGDYLKVPDNFFSGMIELKVISLFGVEFSPSPPLSLCLLTKLQTLVLAGSLLGDISIIGELKSLKILRLERSDLKELPKEIGQLTNLQFLNITNCPRLRFIPANVISSLTCLEELYMGNCFIQWDVKGSKNQSGNASLEELRNLSHLTALDIMIQDASVLPRDLQVFEKLERYNIFVGDKWKWSLAWSGGVPESSRVLKLEDSRSLSILSDRGFNFLLNSAEDMCLAKIHCVGNVFYELNRKGFPQLKNLCIQDSTELKYITDSSGYVHPDPALPNLETLALQNLINLEEICHGPVPIQSFTKLRSFEVKGCDKLKNLLWYSLVSSLPRLSEMKVSNCKMITEIIAMEASEADNENDRTMFPKLHSLELECLPSLISLCSAPLPAHNSPMALFDQKVGMPCLELLKLSKINSRKLWDDILPGRSCIQNLTSLTIDKCGIRTYAFSSSMARELVKLTYLGISNCQMLEEIFVSDENSGCLPLSQQPFSNNEVIFPNLETLEISHMEHLKSIWHNQLAPNSFCKLKQLKIKFCSEISIVFPSCVLEKLQNLKTVTVTDCPALEVVFETQGGGRQTRLEMHLKTLNLKNLPMLKHIWSGNPKESFKFQNLCLLTVITCKSLNHVFPLAVAKELQNLQKLYIAECGIEMVVAHDEMADTVPILIFPELTDLSFRNLTQLRSFYCGLHTLDCPVLRRVDVLHCDNLVLFKPKSLNCQDIVPVDVLPLLSIEKVAPNASELILNIKDVTMLCNGQLNDEHIYTVTALRLRCFHDESDKFPAGFLQRFINLKKLYVTCSSFTDILSRDNHGFIWQEKSEVQPVIQRIETLCLVKCSRLKEVVPSSMLFESLEQLEVGNCAGLENILKSSTVANLPKLWKLCIDGCVKIEEIVASEDENDASELALKLRYLRLTNLPRLSSFCKGKHDFKFPRLMTLYVINCPVMETFSHGMLNAPQLLEVRVTPQAEWEWNGDLNTTIKKIAAKRVM